MAAIDWIGAARMPELRPLRYVFVLAALLSAGCHRAFPNILTVDPNSLRRDQAVVVVSATSENSCPVPSAELLIQKSDDKSVYSLATMQGQNPGGPSDFPDIHGRVYTLALAPGRYDFRLHSLDPQVRFANGSGNSMVTKPVVVEGGEVTYVGEFRDVGCSTKNMVIRNNSERDLRRVKLYKPSLDLSRVRVRMAEVLDN
jgi:hypothetical protein